MAEPNYGIDAWNVIRNLGLVAAASVLLFGTSFFVDVFGGFRYAFLTIGLTFLVTPALMLLYAKVGKFKHRDRMLSMIDWRGDETVLDVGTGRGLLLIGAAKRIKTGKAIGIDIWNENDLSGNCIENTLANAEMEGVASRIEILGEDACKMSFPDATFDAVVSNLCLHNIPDEDGRRDACREIVRVLKPGGRALISDYKNADFYEAVFKGDGLAVARFGPYIIDTFPPLKVLRVDKITAT